MKTGAELLDAILATQRSAERRMPIRLDMLTGRRKQKKGQAGGTSGKASSPTTKSNKSARHTIQRSRQGMVCSRIPAAPALVRRTASQ